MFGFGVGLFVDLAFAQTLGVSALVYSLVGYGAGRVRELRAPEAPFTPLALGAAATAISACGYAVLELLLGVGGSVNGSLVRDILLTIALNSLIAVPVYSVVRRWLIPALPEDPRRRRRRAYTTGGLSPSRARDREPAPAPRAAAAAAHAARRRPRRAWPSCCSRSSASGCGTCRC